MLSVFLLMRNNKENKLSYCEHYNAGQSSIKNYANVKYKIHRNLEFEVISNKTPLSQFILYNTSQRSYRVSFQYINFHLINL